MELIGSHAALAAMPQWLIGLTLALLTWGVVFVGRDRLEGLGYNVSYASVIGDMTLIAIVVMASSMLQRGPVSLPAFWVGANYHLICIAVAYVAGMFSLAAPGEPIGNKTAMDIYHGVVVLPLYVYLLLSVAPVIWVSGSKGWTGEIAGAVCLLCVWGWMFIVDAKEGRLNQPGWLEKHNIKWTKPPPEPAVPPSEQ